VIAKLRNRRFFSLADSNVAIREIGHAAQRSRDAASGDQPACAVQEIERPALKKLPVEPYVYAQWKEAGSASTTTSKSSGINYSVRTRCCARRCGHGSRRAPSRSSIAAIGSRLHMRSSSDRRHTTVREAHAEQHRRYADWTPERIRRQAGEIGRNYRGADRDHPARALSHPEQGFRAAVGNHPAGQELCPRPGW